MDEHKNRWAEKLERHLHLACDAEANGDLNEAERQFRRAVFCESRLRSDVAHGKDYVKMVGPIYPTDAASSGDKTMAQSQENSHETEDPAQSRWLALPRD